MNDDKAFLKEIFYANDTRQHQQYVAGYMIECAKRLLDRATKHDASKLAEPEISHYINPVFHLNTEKVEFGSERYKELTAQMGKGWDHHKTHNDHHIEFFEPYSVQTLNDPIKAMDLFCIIEMICDWIAASKRRGNNPSEALDYLKKKYQFDEQLEAVIRNTLAIMERSNGKNDGSR